MDQFKQGDLNVLVSTNVGEEGLDIAECDLVIFYDVVASEIRFIQRRGRTGRHRKGKVIILYCKNTHDEIYMNIALSKLKRMNLNLKSKEKSPRVPNLTISPKSIDHVEPTPNKAKGDKSKIDFFLNTTPRRSTPLESEVILSTSLPSKFGLRKKLQEAQIAVEVATSKYHIVLFDKVIIQIIQPQVLKTDTLYTTPSWLSILTRIFQLCILVVDFIDFKEAFEGEERLLKTSIMEFGKKHNFQTVNIDNPEELYFIIKNIYDHTKQKRE